MSNKRVLDIMLDLEFFGTEEDMIRDYPGEDAFPIVSSIGLVVQLNGEIKFSENFALNFSEQIEGDAKFGKRCMIEFWTTQELFGQEMARTLSQNETLHRTLTEIAMKINAMKATFEPTEVNVLGNNIIADNAKVIRLFAKYAYTELPWSYFENTDYRELRKVCKFLGFDVRLAESNFEADVLNGKYTHLGHNSMALHNAEFDCIKQLAILNAMRAFLDKARTNLGSLYA